MARPTTAAPVSFFEHQARARSQTGRLVVLFLLAVMGVVLAVNLVIAGAGGRDRHVFVWTTLVTLAVIALRTLFAVQALRAGGDAVARMAGGVPVDRATRDPDERRLLNVVDEMAIASGVTVPRVYVLPHERGINAFAAGYAPNQAAIAVTAGALRELTRDELQGVIGHEFSHVLNGDMRLNIRMIGVLAGILFIGEIGGFLMRSTSDRDRDSSRNGLVMVGLGLTVVGYVGLFFGRLIKAGVSRQREFLADVSSVQFTRHPEGLAGALLVIDRHGSLVQARHAETLSHMFFAQGVTMWFASVFATHPPVPERIHRIDSRFVAADYFARRTRTLEAAVDGEAPAAARPVETVAGFAPIASGTQAPAGRPPGSPPSRSAASVLGSVGRPTPEHVDYAAKMLAALPAEIREAANDRTAAAGLIFAFPLSTDEIARKQQLALLDRAGHDGLARQAELLAGPVRMLPAGFRLPVVALALGTLRELTQTARDTLIRDLILVIEADQQITLEEFALLAVVRSQLAPKAAGAAPVKYRSILQVEADARLVLSVLAHAGGDETDRAFARGLEKLALRGTATPAARIAFPQVAEALARLRHLAPFVKRAFLEASVETVMADQTIKLGEAELLRAIATTLDCPIPPVLATVDPATLA